MISAKKNNFLLEYHPESIRVARVSLKDGGILVDDIAELDVADRDALPTKILRFADAKKNGYLSGLCAIYPEQRFMRKTLIDSGKGKETDFIVDFIRDEVNIEPDSVQAYCLSPKTGLDDVPAAFNKKDVIICGAEKKEVVELQNELLEISVFPQRLEIGSFNLAGVFKDLISKSDNDQPLLILEIETSNTHAMIVGANGVEMSRKIEFGVNDIASSLMDEMKLKNEEAAWKLLGSNAFDFGSMSPKLLRRLLRELQSSIGFFEVQTGQSVSLIHSIRHDDKFKWLQDSVCNLLNLEPFTINVSDWLETRNIRFGNDELGEKIDDSWLGLFSLACEFKDDSK